MTNSKSTKRALMTSALATLLCVAMLIGTTFAWFTDSASTGVNKIQSGSLDMEVEYTLDGVTWKPLDESTDLFGAGKFEPGYTRLVAFRISNNGDLAFKYKIGMHVVSETKGVNKAGEEFALSDYLKVKTSPVQSANDIGDIMLSYALTNRTNSIPWTENNFADFSIEKAANGQDFTISAGGGAQYFMMQVYMPTTVGNEANAISEDKEPTISFGVEFDATQAPVENDSYDNQYDKDATYPTEATTAP